MDRLQEYNKINEIDVETMRTRKMTGKLKKNGNSRGRCHLRHYTKLEQKLESGNITSFIQGFSKTFQNKKKTFKTTAATSGKN